MEGVIYKITNNINNKVYIGQTVQKIQNRFYQHCATNCSEAVKNMAIHRAIHKYGKTTFTMEVLESCPKKMLDEREKFWINYYDSYNNGYNSTLGGKKGNKPFKNLNNSDIISMYNKGYSLRLIALKYNVDKETIKNILVRTGIKIRTTRTYKLSQLTRQALIMDYNNGLSRKEILSKYNISKSYLSQLINGTRRI